MKPSAVVLALRSLGLLLVAVALGACDATQDLGQGAGACATGLTRCGAVCVDVQSDPDHCGSCTTACATAEVCGAGQCMPTCPQDTTSCSRACVSLVTDAHCGACATTCSGGAHCANGQQCSTCAAGTTYCPLPPGVAGVGGVCSDLATDPANCGRCGNDCQQRACSNGSCR